MTSYVDLELDEETIRQGERYGLIEERDDGHRYLTATGSSALKEYIEQRWKELPYCPKCEQKALLDNDYICKSCRYGYVDGVIFTGY